MKVSKQKILHCSTVLIQLIQNMLRSPFYFRPENQYQGALFRHCSNAQALENHGHNINQAEYLSEPHATQSPGGKSVAPSQRGVARSYHRFIILVLFRVLRWKRKLTGTSFQCKTRIVDFLDEWIAAFPTKRDSKGFSGLLSWNVPSMLLSPPPNLGEGSFWALEELLTKVLCKHVLKQRK